MNILCNEGGFVGKFVNMEDFGLRETLLWERLVQNEGAPMF